jgi:4'-phosphopantetheinyl transferase
MQIAAVSITRNVPRQELAGQLAGTSREKAQRLERYYRDEDFLRGLLGDLLVRHMIARRTGLEPSALVFAADEFGKPSLVERPGVEFNLSHSGAWVVCAVGHTPVGVDVEKIRPVEPGISHRFFSAAEDEQLRQADPAQRLERFFTLWTLKESYMKMKGQGLAMPLNAFSVVASASGGFRVHTAEGPVDDVCLAASDRLAGYKLAVCGRTPPPIEAVESLSMEQLLALPG